MDNCISLYCILFFRNKCIENSNQYPPTIITIENINRITSTAFISQRYSIMDQLIQEHKEMFSQRQIGKILLLLCCLLLSSTTFATTKNPPTSLINSSIASKTELKAKEQTSDSYYVFEDHFENGLDEKIWKIESKTNLNSVRVENNTLLLTANDRDIYSNYLTRVISIELPFNKRFTLERKIRNKFDNDFVIAFYYSLAFFL